MAEAELTYDDRCLLDDALQAYGLSMSERDAGLDMIDRLVSRPDYLEILEVLKDLWNLLENGQRGKLAGQKTQSTLKMSEDENEFRGQLILELKEMNQHLDDITIYLRHISEK